MVPDVATGDPNAMLCLHCARHIVSPRPASKYGGLTNHLKFRAAFTGIVRLSFARIDGLIGSNLPMNAFRDEGLVEQFLIERAHEGLVGRWLGGSGSKPQRRLRDFQESA